MIRILLGIKLKNLTHKLYTIFPWTIYFGLQNELASHTYFFFSVQPASQSASKNYKKAIFSFAFSLLNWKTVEIILGVRMGLDTGMLYTGKGCWPSGPTGARILCPLQSKPLHSTPRWRQSGKCVQTMSDSKIQVGVSEIWNMKFERQIVFAKILMDF